MPRIVIKSVKSGYKAPDLFGVVEKERRKESRKVQREFEQTTRTWKTDVDFEIRDAGEDTVIGTSNKVYGYVDKGTRPHVIKAKNAKSLKFNTRGFRAKSVPNKLTARAGSPAKPPTAYPVQVKHPGNKARGFSKLIQERSKKRFAQNVQKAVKEAVRRAKG